ncbi:unnamed protein product [marine sediment metagenome]|uniref:Uncharacterized protein n=1 Tax=marine sediment metagenome TaxID=412755 RepID=X0V1E7_9ZZZZ
MQEPNKKRIAIDITKHTKTFINYGGQEVTQEQALRPNNNLNKPPVDRGTEENGQGDKG